MRTARGSSSSRWLLVASAVALLLSPSLVADEVVVPPCVPGTLCCFADADGDPWDLSFAAGTQTTRGPSPVGDWSYEFSICTNVAPNPPSCQAAGVFGAAAVRFDGFACEALGPDIDLAPTAVTVTKAGAGVLMMWTAPSGLLTFSLEIECAELSAIPGLATEGDSPQVLWRQEGICTAGPGPAIPPVPEAATSKWGRSFLIILGVFCFL